MDALDKMNMFTFWATPVGRVFMVCGISFNGKDMSEINLVEISNNRKEPLGWNWQKVATVREQVEKGGLRLVAGEIKVVVVD